MITRDPRCRFETGIYVVGFTSASGDKYFHVKLGPKTVICGYENLYGHKAEYTYKTLMHMDAFGLRKTKLNDIFEDKNEFKC